MSYFKHTIDVEGDVVASRQGKFLTTTLAPLVVASSMLVASLNADLLDGNHGSFYLNAQNLTNKYTTLAGWGITDAYTKLEADARYAPIVHNHDGQYRPTSWTPTLQQVLAEGSTATGLDIILSGGEVRVQSSAAPVAGAILGTEDMGGYIAGKLVLRDSNYNALALYAGLGHMFLSSGAQFRVDSDPVNDNDLARKAYVDGLWSSKLATSTVYGTVKLYSDTVQTATMAAIGTTAARTYGIQVNAAGQLVVNVPWSYSNMSAAELTTGTVTTARLISAKTLNDWLNGKNYYVTPSGTTSQYVRGDGSIATLPVSAMPDLNQVLVQGNTGEHDINLSTPNYIGLNLYHSDVSQYQASFYVGPTGGRLLFYDYTNSWSLAYDGGQYVTLNAGSQLRVQQDPVNANDLARKSYVDVGLALKYNTPGGTTAQYIRGDGSLATFPIIPAGTVTSVGLSAPTGFSVAGSPVTASGTLALSFAAGYSLPTTAKQTQWDTAYGWGPHAGVYLPLAGGTMMASALAKIKWGSPTSTGSPGIFGTTDTTRGYGIWLGQNLDPGEGSTFTQPRGTIPSYALTVNHSGSGIRLLYAAANGTHGAEVTLTEAFRVAGTTGLITTLSHGTSANWYAAYLRDFREFGLAANLTSHQITDDLNLVDTTRFNWIVTAYSGLNAPVLPSTSGSLLTQYYAANSATQFFVASASQTAGNSLAWRGKSSSTWRAWRYVWDSQNFPMAIASPSNGQLLQYNSTNSSWSNWTPNYLTSADLSGYYTKVEADASYASIGNYGGDIAQSTETDADLVPWTGFIMHPSGWTNTPTSNGFVMTVRRGTGGYQTFVNHTVDDGFYWRGRGASTYRPWMQAAARSWVTANTRSNTWVPTWTEVTGKPTTFAPAAHTLDSHSNVTITSASANQYLGWSGTAWVNMTLPAATTYTGSTSITLVGSAFQRAALTGDVTASLNSNNLTIANGAVTLAKMQSISDARILGRVSAGSGVVETLTAAQVRTLLNVADGANNYTHPNSGVSAGSYNNVMVNTQGHVTDGSNVAYLTGNQNITLSGDVTGTGATSIATTIANGAISYAKIQNLAGPGLIGRPAAGSGVSSLITLGSGLSFSGSTLVVTGTGGTVTSINLTAPTGFSVAGVPVTNSGTIALTYAAGYSLPTTAKQAQWDAAYSSMDNYVLKAGDTMTGNLTFSPDNTGITLNGGAMVYKRSGGGITFRRHNDASEVSIENAAGTERYRIYSESWAQVKGGSSQVPAGTLESMGLMGGNWFALTADTSDLPTAQNAFVYRLPHYNNSNVFFEMSTPGAVNSKLYTRTKVGANIDSWRALAHEAWVTSNYTATSRQIIAGDGLTGGGNFTADRTITLGTPGSITLSSTNSVSSTSHTHAFAPGGTTAQYVRGDGVLATMPSIPTVNNGQLTLSTGIGLGGSATFTANQAGNVTFNVTVTFGSTSGTVAAGDDSRIGQGATAFTWGNHASYGYVQGGRQVATTGSLQGGGDLSANRTISLMGDSLTPGNNKYYGTNGAGSKGFWDLPASGITGSGTSFYISMFTGGTTVGNSILTQSSGAVTANGDLYVTGKINVTSSTSNFYGQTSFQAYMGIAAEMNFSSTASLRGTPNIYNALMRGYRTTIISLGASGSPGSADCSNYNVFRLSYSGTTNNNVQMTGSPEQGTVVILISENDTNSFVIRNTVRGNSAVTVNGGSVVTLVYAGSYWYIASMHDNNW